MNGKESRRGLALIACLLTIALAMAAGLAWPKDEAQVNPGPTIGAAKVCLAQGDSESAERVLRQLEGPDAKFLLGKLLASRGKWVEARTPLVESASDSNHRTDALRLLARGSMDHADWIGALGFLRELEKAEPNDPKVLKALALCFQRSGDALSAMASAQRGLAVAPDDQELLSLMSEAAETSVMSAARPRLPVGLPQPRRYGRRTR